MPSIPVESENVQEKKRVKGIEPSPKAWEAFVLPLNYTRVGGCVN